MCKDVSGYHSPSSVIAQQALVVTSGSTPVALLIPCQLTIQIVPPSGVQDQSRCRLLRVTAETGSKSLTCENAISGSWMKCQCGHDVWRCAGGISSELMAEPCTWGGYADVCIDSADSGDAGHAADGHSSCATVYVYSVLSTANIYEPYSTTVLHLHSKAHQFSPASLLYLRIRFQR